MLDRYEIDVQNNVAGFNATAEKILMVNNNTLDFDFGVNVIIRDNTIEKDIYNLEIKSEFPGTFFRDTLLIDSQFIIAIENQIYFFNLLTKEFSQHKLDGYFERFHHTDNNIVVASNTYLSCFTFSGRKVWVSEKLSEDKLDVKTLSDEVITGTGNLNNDEGNVDFALSMNNGKSLHSVKKKKRKRVLVNFFASF